MAHVSPDSSDSPSSVIRVSDVEKSGSQIAILCQVAESAAGLLISNPSLGTEVHVDPMARASALKTYELAQLQLRNLIDETARWSLDPSPAEHAADRLVRALIQKTEAHTDLITSAMAPHLRLNARIRRFPDVGWVAWVGDDVPRMSDLNGVGNSPAQAFAAFDRCHSQLVAVAAPAARPPTPPPAPPAVPPKTPPKRRDNRKKK